MSINMFAHFFSSKRSQPTMKFDKENVLGRGFSAQVFSGTFNGKDVAVKRIEKSVGLNLDKAAQELEEETMKNLDHPNVLKLLHVQDDNDFKYLCSLEIS